MFKFKEPFDVISLTKHSDPRGDLFEVLRFKDQHIPGKGYIYCFTINPGVRRGDHYHTKKLEWATCVSGEATIFFEDKDGKKTKISISASEPKLVYFGPYTSHTFLNETKSLATIVCYGSKQHDPKDPDTIPKVVEYGN